MNKFFSKIILWLFLLLFLPPILISTTFAQNGLSFGQNHSYIVNFRDNGEAIVYAKLAITNIEEKPLTEFSFRIPKVSPSEIVIYQMKLLKCVRYGYIISGQPSCLEWRWPGFTDEQRYYYEGEEYKGDKAEYQKVQFIKSGDLYRFALPTPLRPGESAAIIVAYAAEGYAEEKLGLFKFTFETMEVPSRVEKVKVAVDVDPNLFIKNEQGRVAFNVPSFFGVVEPHAISSDDLDWLVKDIESNGHQLIRETENLAPNETWAVKGEYAVNSIALYLDLIIIAVLVVIVTLASVYFLARFLKQNSGKRKKSEQETNPEMMSRVSQNSTGSILNLINVLASLLSAVLLAGITYFFGLLFSSDLFSFISVIGLDMILFAVFSSIIVILYYVLIIFGPASVVAIKYGRRSAVSVLVMEGLWLLIFFAVYILFFDQGSFYL